MPDSALYGSPPRAGLGVPTGAGRAKQTQTGTLWTEPGRPQGSLWPAREWGGSQPSPCQGPAHAGWLKTAPAIGAGQWVRVHLEHTASCPCRGEPQLSVETSSAKPVLFSYLP